MIMFRYDPTGNTAYTEGYDAYLDGAQLEDNPFPLKHESRSKWRDGWLDAQEDQMEDEYDYEEDDWLW